MNITQEKIDDLNGIIKVNIEKSDYEANMEQVLKDHRKKANMPGFRPGKVPAGLIKKMYGQAVLVDEVNKLLSNELSKYLIEEKLNILGEPMPNEEKQKEIDWDKDTDFEFVFDIGFAPEPKITLDKRSKYIFNKIKVSDELIDEQVKNHQLRFGENKEAEEVVEKESVRGDIKQLDENGEVKEDGVSADMALIAIDVIKDEEIKKQFIGKKVGDVVVFDIKKAYPNDTEIAYLLNVEKEEAEKIEGDFKIEIKEISTFVEAEVNEDLFKKVLGEDTDVKDEKIFREKVADQIAEQYEASSDYLFANDARDALLKKVKMEFPEEFLKRWVKAANKDITDEQIEADFENFLQDLKWQIIKDQIIKDNELKVEEEEVVDLAKEVALAQFRQYGMFDVPEEHLDGFAKQMLEKEEDRNRLYQKKMEDKVIGVVKEKTTVEENELPKEEFEKLFPKN